MTDSVNVFPAGMRLTDSDTGAPIEGAVIYFYDAGTTTPKTVYSDQDLTVAIGTSVTTDALGYPTTNGTTKTLVYTGTANYKIIVKDASNVTIAEHDNVKGAVATVDTSSLTLNTTNPVVVKTSAYTIVKADQNKIIAADSTSASFTLTLPSAVEAGLGWGVIIQHTGTANTVTLATVSSQTIQRGGTSLGTSTTLAINGDQVKLVSDGGNWRVINNVRYAITALTSQATTSGTSVPFTGIPSSARRITVMFSGVGTSGSSNLLVQLGSGSTDSANYFGSVCFMDSAATPTVVSSTNSAGFPIRNKTSGSLHGNMTLTRLTGNTWVSNHSISVSASSCSVGGGSKALAGALDRVIISTTSTDTFSAGSVNILYE